MMLGWRWHVSAQARPATISRSQVRVDCDMLPPKIGLSQFEEADTVEAAAAMRGRLPHSPLAGTKKAKKNSRLQYSLNI
jgi:hypothetical protein